MQRSLIGQQCSIGLRGLDTGHPSPITDAVAPRPHQKDFFLNPSKAYSEVLEKSIGGPRKRKEVFELGGVLNLASQSHVVACGRYVSSSLLLIESCSPIRSLDSYNPQRQAWMGLGTAASRRDSVSRSPHTPRTSTPAED